MKFTEWKEKEFGMPYFLEEPNGSVIKNPKVSFLQTVEKVYNDCFEGSGSIALSEEQLIEIAQDAINYYRCGLTTSQTTTDTEERFKEANFLDAVETFARKVQNAFAEESGLFDEFHANFESEITGGELAVNHFDEEGSPTDTVGEMLEALNTVFSTASLT